MSVRRFAALALVLLVLEGMTSLVAEALSQVRPYSFGEEFLSLNLGYALGAALVGLGWVALQLWDDR